MVEFKRDSIPPGPWGITVSEHGAYCIRFGHIKRARNLPDKRAEIILPNGEVLLVPENWSITIFGRAAMYLF